MIQNQYKQYEQLHQLYLLLMSEQSQSRVHTEQEFRELQDDLNRANERIKSLKNMEKNYQTTVATFKKKIARLEKANEQLSNNLTQNRAQELNRTIEYLTSEVTQLKKDNSELNEQKIRIEKKVKELKEAEITGQRHKETQARLEKEVDSLRYELEKNKLNEVKPVSVVNPKQGEKIKRLEKELTLANKKILDLQANNRSHSRPDTPNSKKSDNHEASTISMGASRASQKLEFFDGVHQSLQLFEDDRIHYPSTHEKILDLIDDYLSKLKPKFQISFLNILATTAEAKIDTIDQFLSYTEQLQ